jgi:polar amino acid transport system substrate-binding protein
MIKARGLGLRGAAVVVAVAGLALSGCGQAPSRGTAADEVRPAATTTTTTTTTTAAAAAPSKPCADGRPVVASIDPGGITSDRSTWPAGSTMKKIVDRGRLIVGTSADAQRWGATNPVGNLTGYDVDLAKEVANALGLRRPDQIEYKVLALSDRQAALNRPAGEGGVDLVAERMTITCARWEGTSAASPAVNFSAPYYVAGQQRLLVRLDNTTAQGIEDFTDQPVCGVTGSSSLAGIQGKGAKIIEAPSAGQCLVMFQEGEAVAVTGDDTTLAGLNSQDPKFSKIIGPSIANVPYGIGLPPGDAPFTQFVNSVLADLRSGSGDSSLTGLYDRWMKPQVGGSAPVTTPVYGRDVAGLKQKTS